MEKSVKFAFVLFFMSAVFSILPNAGMADEKSAGLLEVIRKIESEGRARQPASKESGQSENLEAAIGDNLAIEGFRRYGLPVKNPDSQRYVNLIGNSLARNARFSDTPFYFAIVENPAYVSFACPGGIVFISSGFVKSMGDEAELACLVAHEIAHMDNRHLLHAIRTEEVGTDFDGMMKTLYGVLFERGLDKDHEFQADEDGMEIAYRTGYDPAGMARILKILENNRNSAPKKGTWYETHPPLSERIKRCQKHAEKYPDSGTLAKVKGRFSENRARLAGAPE